MSASRSLVRRRSDEQLHRRSTRNGDIDKPRAKKTEGLAKSLKGKGELILVVDDETCVLRVTKMILEGLNYRVLCASNAPVAMTIFAQHMSVIAAIITDINMPSMDGISLVRAIAKMKPDATFIVVTGEGEAARVSGLENLAVKNFLMKPYKIDRLLIACAMPWKANRATWRNLLIGRSHSVAEQNFLKE